MLEHLSRRRCLMFSGVSSYEAYAWFGPVAPAGTPAAVLERLVDAMRRAAASTAVQGELSAMGVEPCVATARQFGEVIEGDTANGPASSVALA
jgi:tripartite-type tricarboxylate transporter receptor subunit TctC